MKEYADRVTHMIAVACSRSHTWEERVDTCKATTGFFFAACLQKYAVTVDPWAEEIGFVSSALTTGIVVGVRTYVESSEAEKQAIADQAAKQAAAMLEQDGKAARV